MIISNDAAFNPWYSVLLVCIRGDSCLCLADARGRIMAILPVSAVQAVIIALRVMMTTYQQSPTHSYPQCNVSSFCATKAVAGATTHAAADAILAVRGKKAEGHDARHGRRRVLPDLIGR